MNSMVIFDFMQFILQTELYFPIKAKQFHCQGQCLAVCQSVLKTFLENPVRNFLEEIRFDPEESKVQELFHAKNLEHFLPKVTDK